MITADELRQAALSLPEAEERETWGHPTFRVRDKMFATLADDGGQASVKATPAGAGGPRRRRPGDLRGPSLCGSPWLGQHPAGHRRPVEVRELLEEAWRQTAPKRLVATYDAKAPAPGDLGPTA